jgi:hypothetical protein
MSEIQGSMHSAHGYWNSPIVGHGSRLIRDGAGIHGSNTQREKEDAAEIRLARRSEGSASRRACALRPSTLRTGDSQQFLPRALRDAEKLE